MSTSSDYWGNPTRRFIHKNKGGRAECQNEHTERLARLEQERKEHMQSWRLNPVVEARQALRGVQFTVAVTLVAERGDLTRFDHPTELMKYLVHYQDRSCVRRHWMAYDVV
jgi:transposase